MSQPERNKTYVDAQVQGADYLEKPRSETARQENPVEPSTAIEPIGNSC